MRHLPTNGGGPALTALLGNNSQVLASSVVGRHGADQGRQGCGRWPAFGGKRSKASAGRADHEGELGYDVEYLSLGRDCSRPRRTPADIVDDLSARDLEQGGRLRTSSRPRIANLGRNRAYMDQPDFATFWDEPMPSASKARSREIRLALASSSSGPAQTRGSACATNERTVCAASRGPPTVLTRRCAGWTESMTLDIAPITSPAASSSALGIAVLALSGDLPVGTLSLPGAGMMPKLMAGSDDRVRRLARRSRAREKRRSRSLRVGRPDRTPRRSSPITAVAIAALQPRSGFVVTMALLLFTLTWSASSAARCCAAAAYQRRRAGRAHLSAVRASCCKTPLEPGVLGF